MPVRREPKKEVKPEVIDLLKEYKGMATTKSELMENKKLSVYEKMRNIKKFVARYEAS